MDYNNYSNLIGEVLSEALGGECSFLDKNNIVWKLVNDKWIGKRSIWTKDWRS